MYTVGILYPGDMGHSVARVLLEDGFAVVTTIVGWWGVSDQFPLLRPPPQRGNGM
jgi:hypothetical protein